MGEKTKYSYKMNQNAQNDKCKGSCIFNIDTCRGCTNKCDSCYPERNAMRKLFDIPVKVTQYYGKRQDQKGAWYRIGNSGDPATFWKHAEELVKKQQYKRFFCVTKLQTLKGYSGFFDKLQVSVDPLNKKHFKKTLANVLTILKKYPHVKIMLRIRSISTTDKKLIALMESAVEFANTHNLPVMETRMRFNSNARYDKYSLIRENYKWRNGYIRPHDGLRFITGANKYYDCDLNGGKCKNCSNCTLPWTNKQFNKKGEFIANEFEVVGIHKGKEYTFKTFKTKKGANNFIKNHCDETLFISGDAA